LLQVLPREHIAPHLPLGAGVRRARRRRLRVAGREPGGVALWCDKRVVVLPPLVIDGEEVQELTLLVDDTNAAPGRAHAILREALPLEQELWPLPLPPLPHLVIDTLDHLHMS